VPGRPSWPIVLVAAVPLLLLGVVLSILLVGSSADAGCGPGGAGVTIDPSSVPAGSVAGYSGEQLVNAAYVLKAGKDLGLDVRDQTIGVMTAMGESSLRVIDYGDTAGPDSRGLFQQRANGAWGSYEDRMDPYISSTNFFKAMMKIPDRESLEPTIVAHRTQRNADPYHYTKFWQPAVDVVESLSGVDTGLGSGAGAGACGDLVPGAVNDHGWASPGAGPINSGFGMRLDPVSGAYTRLHAGVDLQAGGCDGPIWAAHAGKVTFAGFFSDGTGAIVVDHGSDVATRYLHMYSSGILVRVGDEVAAGQQIARVGSSGHSTGCHLHFEVQLHGKSVDPQPFMSAAGITLGG